MLQSYADKTNRPVATAYGYKFEVVPSNISSEDVVEVSKDDLTFAQSMNFEVINREDMMTPRIKEHFETLTARLTKLGLENGLDAQSYQCATCKCPIGLVFGEAKFCKYDGNYYCCECHVDDERLIPARILMNWDFRRHRVCVRSAEFLDSIECQPVLDIQEVNKVLYHYIPELEETKVSYCSSFYPSHIIITIPIP
jgi:hypothetical protein